MSQIVKNKNNLKKALEDFLFLDFTKEAADYINDL